MKVQELSSGSRDARVVFVSAKDDLAAFRECFGLAGRHNDVTLYARGPLVCLSLQSTARASGPSEAVAGADATPDTAQSNGPSPT